MKRKPEPLGKGGLLRGSEYNRAVKEWPEAYVKGASIRDIARKANRAYGTVRKILLEQEVILRVPGSYKRTKK